MDEPAVRAEFSSRTGMLVFDIYLSKSSATDDLCYQKLYFVARVSKTAVKQVMVQGQQAVRCAFAVGVPPNGTTVVSDTNICEFYKGGLVDGVISATSSKRNTNRFGFEPDPQERPEVIRASEELPPLWTPELPPELKTFLLNTEFAANEVIIYKYRHTGRRCDRPAVRPEFEELRRTLLFRLYNANSTFIPKSEECESNHYFAARINKNTVKHVVVEGLEASRSTFLVGGFPRPTSSVSDGEACAEACVLYSNQLLVNTPHKRADPMFRSLQELAAARVRLESREKQFVQDTDFSTHEVMVFPYRHSYGPDDRDVELYCNFDTATGTLTFTLWCASLARQQCSPKWYGRAYHILARIKKAAVERVLVVGPRGLKSTFLVGVTPSLAPPVPDPNICVMYGHGFIGGWIPFDRSDPMFHSAGELSAACILPHVSDELRKFLLDTDFTVNAVMVYLYEHDGSRFDRPAVRPEYDAVTCQLSFRNYDAYTRFEDSDAESSDDDKEDRILYHQSSKQTRIEVSHKTKPSDEPIEYSSFKKSERKELKMVQLKWVVLRLNSN